MDAFDLPTIWFVLIAVLWCGYFVLEGFDFGVGALYRLLGRGDDQLDGETRKRMMLSTIGPVWDGNEVWLITAAGAMFAAFPHWYATFFSGFYMFMLLVLVALIVRALGFDYRGKVDDPRWRARWDHAIVFGSLVPAAVWGIVMTNMVLGVPIDADMEFTGSILEMLNPAALLGGVVTIGVFATHGAMFLALKTTGVLRHQARSWALRIGGVAGLLGALWLGLIHSSTGSSLSWVLAFASAAAYGLGLVMAGAHREGWAFVGTFAAIGLTVASAFVALFPNVMPSTTAEAFSLTIANASSSDYTLTIMTWVALAFTPIVVLYQGWTYWVFRKRVSSHHIPTSTAGTRS